MVHKRVEEKKAGNAGGSRQGKLRYGGFKNSGVLAGPCGTNAGAFSLFPIAVNPFSIRDPNIEPVATPLDGQASDPARIRKLQDQLSKLMEELEYETRRGEALRKEIEETCAANNIKRVWEMNLDELNDFQGWLEKLRAEITEKLKEMKAPSSLHLPKEN